MTAAQQYLDVTAHNLANASTTGFKREDVSFNEGLLRLMRGENGEGPPIGEMGAGPYMQERVIVWEVGNPIRTGNPFDVSVLSPKGLFAVQTPDGISYTRSGSFSLNDQKQLVTKAGHPVLDAQGSPIQIPLNTASAEITDSGAVMADGAPIAQLGLWDGDATRQGDSLLGLENPVLMDEVKLASRSIEASNVNAIEQMVMMIQIHRAFEMAQKSATSQDEATSGLIQSMNQR